MNGIFITGTDTGIGKTWFTAALTRSLRQHGIPALALKPFACGDRADAEQFAAANDETLSLNDINPVHLAPPLSPYAACVVEDKPLDWQAVRETLERLADLHSGPFLIEAVGGWKVPLTRTEAVADWAREVALPVLIVARAGLGTLNHTLLTVESIRRDGCNPIGIALNFHGCAADDLAVITNPGILAELSGLPVMEFNSGQTRIEPASWLLPYLTAPTGSKE